MKQEYEVCPVCGRVLTHQLEEWDDSLDLLCYGTGKDPTCSPPTKGVKMNRETKIEACARAAHEANRAYCLALGDTSQPAWDDAPGWQQSSARNGVRGVLDGNTPRESHENWLEEKRANGWRYGPVKDPDNKEHPCFVPYDELPTEQRQKDHVFVAVVTAMAKALGI